ncbi:Uncharacterised protein [Legionella beliardensis]|uniref:Uncharacterized protein n=2 Tax=Legionella beliardensis TaxID=91822 RepID=A0A378JPB9_9GAMM|nr:Uncharacterised protein [Legionella beliardensis]
MPHASSDIAPQSHSIEKMMSFTNIPKMATSRVTQSSLPSPYNYLLTQPLMTKGLEKYYQRTPIIQTIYAKKNKHDNTYYRAIIMLVDSNKTRNNPELAQKKKEAAVIELAFIRMNFNELPKKVIADVLNTNIPFGKLLLNNHIKTFSTDRSYFSIKCNEAFSSLMRCKLNSQLYGRTNSLIRMDNNRLIAHVVEILP